ncbi:MAG TPA: glycosyltransferase family 4 protein [bacterium]|nr:glycosyltransferase family 4 protein [bacterium]
MKIGLVSNMYPSENDKNYGVFVKGLVDSMSKKGVEFSFTAVIKGKQNGRWQKIWAYLKLYFSAVFNLLFKECDIVFLHYPLHLAPLIYMMNIFMIKPLVVNFHGTDMNPQSKGLQVLENILKRSLDNVKMVVVPSSFLKKEVMKKYGVPEEKIFVSPSGGVDFDKFRSFDDNPAAVKPYLAGYVSRLTKEKGCDVFLESVISLKREGSVEGKKFLIAGTGPMQNEISDTIRKEGLQETVEFKNINDQSMLPQFFNDMELFVFPSLSESLGLVGLEAMACGTPVTGSEIGGISDYLTDGQNGYFFKAGDPSDLAQKIRQFMLLTRIEKMRFKENAKNTATQYERERVVSMLIRMLELLLF